MSSAIIILYIFSALMFLAICNKLVNLEGRRKKQLNVQLQLSDQISDIAFRINELENQIMSVKSEIIDLVDDAIENSLGEDEFENEVSYKLIPDKKFRD